MKNDEKYDEKQIIDRGKAFQIGFLTALIEMLGMYFLAGVFEITVSTDSVFLICLWIPITVCSIMLIVKDAYDGVNSAAGRVICTMFIMLGLLMLITFIVQAAKGRERLTHYGMVTDAAGHLFNSICLLLIGIVYWAKQYKNKKKYERE